MIHRRFSLEVPSASEKSTNARPLLYRFDKRLEENGYETVETRILEDNPISLSKSYTRTTKTSRVMVSDKSYLMFTTDQLIQQEKGKNYHSAGISGIVSVCEEKDLEGFKKIIEDVFSIKDLQLRKL